MDALKFRKLISFTTVQYNKPNFTKYSNILLTEYGLTQGEKVSSQIPLFGLANQSIKTGDPITDKKINHARELFFREPSTMDNMRSACEALSFVLEPLRDELAPTITTADVNEFFLIINRFDVRHNKASTKSLVYPEQLEWVFYSLLNTINTYTKLKSRLNS